MELKHAIFGFEPSNIEPNRAITRFTKLHIKQTQTSFFPTLNKLEGIHLLVIKLQHPNFAFERSNIELQTWFDPSLVNFKW